MYRLYNVHHYLSILLKTLLLYSKVRASLTLGMYEYRYNTDPSFVLNDLLDLFERLDIQIFVHLDRRHYRFAFGNRLFHHALSEVTFADSTASRR